MGLRQKDTVQLARFNSGGTDTYNIWVLTA